MFNKYVWDLYLKSGGQETVNLFENIHNDCSKSNVSIFAEKINEYISFYNPCCNITNHIQDEILKLFENINANESEFRFGCYSITDLPERKYSIYDIMDFFKNFLLKVYNSSDAFFEFSDSIEYYSCFMYLMFPDLFVPYFFKYSFICLEKIATEYDIEIPLLPVKKDYISRILYYGEICSSLNDFRNKNRLSSAELCAFLYDFAPKSLGGYKAFISKELPQATSAFFIGTTPKDIFLSSSITPWQCSPEALAGDYAVMYTRTPVSAVTSVSRCVSDGFIDPFFYYYRCAYISDSKAITHIPKSKLEKDKIFKDFPLVRKNMQGVNGVELLPSQFNHLMDMAKEKKLKLSYDTTDTGIELMREHDVEEQLILPLIKRLGYNENDYIYQMHIEIGNHNNTLIPDYVLLPDTTKGQQTAFAIIEAKLDIPNKAAFDEVKIQARSYARQCLSEYSLIASGKKVWLSSRKDDFTEDIFSATWAELNDPDIFSELSKLIGRKHI